MRKILIITYYWPPSGGAGVQRWLKMAKYLPSFGFEPIILTVDPSDASYPIRDESLVRETEGISTCRTKSFEPLKLYGSVFGKTNVPYSGFSNLETDSFFSKVTRWMRGNFFIPDARKGWNKYALPKALELIEKFNIDLVITTGPPHSTHLIGKILKERKSLTWIADFRDPWTDIYYYDDLLLSEKNKLKDTALELSVLKTADIIFAVCPSNLKLLSSKLHTATSESGFGARVTLEIT